MFRRKESRIILIAIYTTGLPTLVSSLTVVTAQILVVVDRSVQDLPTPVCFGLEKPF